MFWKKKSQEQAEQEKKFNFFSTDPSQLLSKKFNLNASVAKSIQKTPDHFKSINADGSVNTMDSSSLQQAKSVFGVANPSIPNGQIDWYASQGFIGYQLCAILAQNWLIDKACSVPARDAIRKGYEITINNGEEVKPEVLDELRALDKKYKLNKNLVEFVRFGRIFGIRVAMFKIEGIDYELPYNPDGVKEGSYKGIVQIDPYWITPELDMASASDPANLHFYEPTWWRVNGQRIHRSHLCIFRNSEVSDLLKPSYLYGSVSVPQKIAERVYAAERTANEMPMLTMTKRMITYKVDIAQAMADQASIEQKIEAWVALMNNYGVKIIGENEEVNQFDTNLTGLDDVVMTQYQIVAGASNIPVTKLLGTVPKGFNSTGEHEEANYHEELESIQEHDLTPLIQRHHELLIRSELPKKFSEFSGRPFETTVAWKPLDSLTAKELAEINSLKADTGLKLQQAGAIDGEDERQRLINDPDSGYNGMPEEVAEDPLNMNTPVENEENLNAEVINEKENDLDKSA